MHISPIYNSSDLRAEIFRLKGLEEEKKAVLQKRFSSPGAIFSTVFSMFKSSNTEDDKDGGIFKQDFVGVLSRFILPLTLNKTIFRNSNFIVKALVGLVSQKASHYISEDTVGGIWDKAKGLFANLLHKEKKPAPSYKKIKKD
jgi:hypothetical protein